MRRLLPVAALAWMLVLVSGAHATIYPGKGAVTGRFGEPAVTKAPGPVPTAQGPRHVNTWWFDWSTTRATSQGDARVVNHRVCLFVSVDGGNYVQLQGDRADGCYAMPNESGQAGTADGGFPVWRGARGWSVYVEPGHTYTAWARQYYDYSGLTTNYRDEYPSNGAQVGALTRTWIDTVKPTTSITIENGASTTNKNIVDLSITYADNSNLVWQDTGATWLCAYRDRQCQANETLPGSSASAWTNAPCTAYNPAPNGRTCQLDLTGVPDGPLTKCTMVADAAIPDNGQTPDQYVRPDNRNVAVDASFANLSDPACDSITLDRDEPALNPTATPTTQKVGTPISFAANASDPNLDRVEWTMGDGSPTKTGQNISHAYATTGTKTVTVKAFDTGGGSQTRQLTVTITAGDPAPAAQLPASVTFPATPKGGESVGTDVTLTNTGTLPLRFTQPLSLGGTNPTHFSRPNLDGGTCEQPSQFNSDPKLAAGASCTFRFVYQPPAAAGATSTATLSIPTNASGSPHTVTLNGSTLAAGAQLTVSQTTLAFGAQPRGTTSTRTLPVKNTGSAQITGLSFAFSSTDYTKPTFGGCGSTLNARSTCFLTVDFTPSATGARDATLQISSSAGGANIALTGSGTPDAPVASLVHPGSAIMQFGDGLTGSRATRYVTAANVGSPNTNLNLTKVEIVGPDASQFAYDRSLGSPTTDPCTVPGRVPRIESGSQDTKNGCGIVVAFTPTSPGDKHATLRIEHNDPAAPVYELPIEGRGVPELDLDALSFGIALVGATTAPRELTVTNNGRSTITFASIGVAGGDFARSGGTCAASLAAGASCTIAATFTPAAAGQREAVLTILFQGGGSRAIALSGVGTTDALVTGAGLTLSPGTVSFGEREVGSTGDAQTVFVANNGTTPVTLSGIALGGSDAGDFARDGGTCATQTLAAGDVCTVELRYTPTAAGERRATLTVTGDGGSMVTAGLEGVATPKSGGSPSPTPGATPAAPGAAVSPAPTASPRPARDVGAPTRVSGGTIGAALTSATIRRIAGAAAKLRTIRLNGADVLLGTPLKLPRNRAVFPLGLTVKRPGRFEVVLSRRRTTLARGAATFPAARRVGFSLTLAAKAAKPGTYTLRLSFKAKGARKASTKSLPVRFTR